MQAALNIIGEDLINVELQFRKDLESDVPLIRKVGEYVLSSGGKRVRPALLLLAARLCGYRGDQAVPLASVVEFIHTATLLHDDVVDEDQVAHGGFVARPAVDRQIALGSGLLEEPLLGFQHRWNDRRNPGIVDVNAYG